MRKISVPFLVGFAIVSSAGIAVAQGNPDAGMISNSLKPQVESMDGMRASVKLGGTKAGNPFTEAASSLTSASAGANNMIDIPTVKGKIGGGTDFSMPSNALTDRSKDSAMNMANALQATRPGSDMQASVTLGTGTSDLSNSVGDQMSNRLGK